MLNRRLEKRKIPSESSNSIDLVDVKKKLPKIEVDFLELLLHKPEFVDLDTIDVSFFSDPTVKTILTDLLFASKKGIEINAASLLDHLDDEVARSLVIELSSSQLVDEINREDFLDCLSRLKEIKLRREQEKFNKEIYNVSRENGDNSDVLCSLLEQKNKLLKKKQKDILS